jgi:hypothetical protein
MGEGRSVYRVWWRNVREESIGRPRHMWEDSIKVDLQEVEYGFMD